MIKGLKEVEKSLKEKHVPMYLLQGQPAVTVPALAEELKACAGKAIIHTLYMYYIVDL